MSPWVRLHRYTTYLSFLKLMAKLGMPLTERMSMMEFEQYEKKMYKSSG